MLVDLAAMLSTDVYHVMTQVIVPRPIAWVVSDNAREGASADAVPDDERWNVAPFSYFNAVASEPPMVMFSVGRSPRSDELGGPVKDTLANVVARSEHTIALPHLGQLDGVEGTAAVLPPGRSEFGPAGLEPVAWDWPVPRPSGVRVALGCTVDQVLPVAGGPQQVVLARVHVIWIDDEAVGQDAKGRLLVDATVLDPLARLGAGAYGGLGRTARPGRSVHAGL
jgi:flavin reductase (DIM6/NTAB) family NADH-FMN oxidoreductase RutF